MNLKRRNDKKMFFIVRSYEDNNNFILDKTLEHKNILCVSLNYYLHVHYSWSVSIMRNYSILFFIVSKKNIKIFFFQACKINVRELMMKMKRSIDDGDEDVQKGYNFFHICTHLWILHIDTKKGLSSLLFIITANHVFLYSISIIYDA